MTRTQLALLTLGDPQRMTGGYRFHRCLADRASRHGIAFEFVSIPDVPLPWAVLTGPRWLRDSALTRADVVVLDSIAAAAASPWLGRLHAPVIGMLHQPLGGMDSSALERWVRSPFDRWAYAYTGLLMVASEWLADQLVAAGISRSRLRVVPPGKDLVATDGDEPEALGTLRAELRRGRSIAALCVANWLPRKGILELLDAVSRLQGDLVTLHLVGDTRAHRRYAGRVRRRLAEADLRERVVIHEVIEPGAVARMYRTADVFVLPSFEEPYGTVWGEAMAAGLPVLGWRAGNLPFLADHEWEGLLAPIGDIGGLSQAMERIARDPALRSRLGDAAARRAAARPTWDETAERFFTTIAESLDRYHAGASSARHS